MLQGEACAAFSATWKLCAVSASSFAAAVRALPSHFVMSCIACVAPSACSRLFTLHEVWQGQEYAHGQRQAFSEFDCCSLSMSALESFSMATRSVFKVSTSAREAVSSASSLFWAEV